MNAWLATWPNFQRWAPWMLAGAFVVALACALLAAYFMGAPSAGDPLFEDLKGVAFVGSSDGWVVGRDGTILATDDAGAHWQAQISGVREDLTGLSFVSRRVGWAVGAGGTILTTSDGGRNWQRQRTPTDKDLAAVYFVDPLIGWAVGAGGTILTTSDGGRNWQRQRSPTDKDLAAVYFVSPLSGWAVGRGGTILATLDAGLDWRQQWSGIDKNLTGLFFGDIYNGVAVGASGTVLTTVDSGALWRTQSSASDRDLAGVSAYKLSEYKDSGVSKSDVYMNVLIVGANGTIESSGDVLLGNNVHFSIEDSGTSENLYSVTLSDIDGWAVGQNGTILRNHQSAAGRVYWRVQRPDWLQTLRKNRDYSLLAAAAVSMIGAVLAALIYVRFRDEKARMAKKELEVQVQIANVQLHLENVRGDITFTNFESSKTILDDAAFTANLGREFRLVSFEVEEARFFSPFSWNLSPSFNILLGRNGYGKSYILHAMTALMSADFKAMSEMFSSDDAEQRLVLQVKYQRAGSPIPGNRVRIDDNAFDLTQLSYNAGKSGGSQSGGLTSRIGQMPILAVPALRFIDQSSVGVGSGELTDIARNGALHFLGNKPIAGLAQSMLYALCLDYLEVGALDLPRINLIENAITKLAGSRFKVSAIRRSGGALFEIDVIAEGLSDRPMPLQRASQGTLSTVSLFGLIDWFLRELAPGTKPREDVSRRSAIVVIDELDAHLHPTWQRLIVPLLRETFPNVQFVASAHSPLIVTQCLENEVAVLRKTADSRFIVESSPTFIEDDLAGVLKGVFETDPSSGTLSRYVAQLGNRDKLKTTVERFKLKGDSSPAEQTELADAELELRRLERAARTYERQMRLEDLEEYEAALKERVARLEAQAAGLQAQAARAANLEPNPASQRTVGGDQGQPAAKPGVSPLDPT